MGGLGTDALDVMRSVDTDGNGRIEFDEFVQLVRPLYDASASALRATFDLFDADKSGYIDLSELDVMLQRLGLGKDASTHEALQRVFAAVDTDGNGKVDFVEFSGLFVSAAAAPSTAADAPAVAPAAAGGSGSAAAPSCVVI